MVYLLQNVWLCSQNDDAGAWQYFTEAAIFKQKVAAGNATISACRLRIAAIAMACFPLRLGAFAALLALLVSAAAPAHAKHAARNPNNSQQSQTQTGTPAQAVNTVPPQTNQPRYGRAYVPSASPPNGMVQQPVRAQQYQPNAYVSTALPGPSTPPSQGMPVPPPSGNTQGTQTNNVIGFADQYPPKPPRVSFRNGQLSIVAENSTLPDILTAIHQRTGAAMELPTTLGTERVAVKLGPAGTGDVLAALLNGSHFDYIVLNRPEDPSSPERIILREKVTADPNPAAGNGGNNGYVASAQPPEVQEMPETTPEEEEPQPDQPEAAPGQGQEPDANYTPPPGDQSQGKTPEQLLEELRQMQQQRGQPQPQFQPSQPPLVDNGQPQL